ncbi:hypothetical protein [Kitasatospora sp. NPDC088346]|uniref:hypothetical protein n=1 Tax=Kitasatospora sp. NPDC088346 TaxID=3364073 RepID=UPI003827CCDE
MAPGLEPLRQRPVRPRAGRLPRRPDRLDQRPDHPSAGLATRWGPDRSPRTQAHELEALADLLPATAWQPCPTATLADCAPPASDPGPATAPTPPTTTGPVTTPTSPTVRNPAARPTLCGPIALTRETLARWGTAGAGRWRIDAAAVLHVECP